MEIVLKSLEIENFKGIRSKKLYFGNNTTLFGDNGKGKTTVFDAFTWVLFGKDSKNRSDFAIKTISPDGEIIQKINHSVTAIISANDKEYKLQTVLKERWTKQKGNDIPILKGNSTYYYINDAPLKQEEYKNKINELINEDVFKILTSPDYFNNMPWQKCRAILNELIDSKTDLEIVKGQHNLEFLLKELGDVDLELYKKQLLGRKKRLLLELEEIPARVDEVNKSMPETDNYTELEATILSKKIELSNIEQDILNKCRIKDYEKTARSKLAVLNTRLDLITSDINQEYQNKKNSLKKIIYSKTENKEDIIHKLNVLKNRLMAISSNTKSYTYDLEILDNKIQDLNNLKISDDALLCPICNRQYDEKKQTEILQKYRDDKKTKLNNYNFERSKLKLHIEENNIAKITIQNEITICQNELICIDKDILSVNDSLEKLQISDVSDNPEYMAIINQIKELDLGDDISTAVEQMNHIKDELSVEINDLQIKLLSQNNAERCHKRLRDLKLRESQLLHEISKIESREWELQEIIIQRMKALEMQINDKFDIVKFKLFEKLINGNINPCCIATINGVPYSDLNSALKINCGLDIINAMCRHYGTYAPIFIDNRESITNLLTCKSQVIGLMVKKDSELYVM